MDRWEGERLMNSLKRADVLLLLVEERNIYTPQYGAEYLQCLGGASTHVNGAGDMSALRSLERKGLVKRHVRYGQWEITEDGKLRAQEIC